MFSKEKVREQNISCQIMNLIARVEDIREKGEDGRDQDIVAFVGLTKSGKSTLINGLMGTPLTCQMDPKTDDTYLVKGPGAPGPKIGADGGESETVDPASYGNLPGTNLVMWDFPGFGDNKGPDQEILNAISYQKILRNQKSIRFVVVASYLLIKNDNPLPFYNLLHQLKLICPQISDNLCLVCTKLEKGKVSGLLERAVTQQFPNAEDSQRQLISQSQQLLGQILKREAYIDFRAPSEDDVDKPFVLPKKEAILGCIKKLKGTTINNVPLVISDEAKLKIAEYYDLAYFIVKRKVEGMCTSLKNSFSAQAADKIGGTAADKLAIYKNIKLTLDAILAKALNFEDLFAVVRDMGLGKGFAEDITKFSFIEDLKYSYKITANEELVQGQAEFFNSIVLCLKNCEMHYSSLIANSEAITKEEKRKVEEANKKNKEEFEKLKKELKHLSEENAAIASKEKGLFTKLGEGADVVIEKISDKCSIQ